MKVKFFGALAYAHGVVKFDHLGQEESVPEPLVKDLVNGGTCLLPSEQYDSAGITAAEEKKYPYPGDAVKAPGEFQAKREKLMVLWVAFRESLNTAPAEPVEHEA